MNCDHEDDEDDEDETESRVTRRSNTVKAAGVNLALLILQDREDKHFEEVRGHAFHSQQLVFLFLLVQVQK